jgi:hypothetical protein
MAILVSDWPEAFGLLASGQSETRIAIGGHVFSGWKENEESL